MVETHVIAPANPAIVYFDGSCGFCNGMVNFLLEWDRRKSLQFAPLQGETAQQLLRPEEIGDLSSIVVTADGKNYRKSSASVRILWKMGGFWSVLGTLLWLIPRPIRDFGYALLSRFRYTIGGRLEACRMPRDGEQERFLP